MTTFTFDLTRAERLMDDLNNRGTVTLTKANGASIRLRNLLTLDEFGDPVFGFTIQNPGQRTLVENIPMNEADLLSFLSGESFALYGVIYE